jgi:ribose-phosphate pyrophosphokinase
VFSSNALERLQAAGFEELIVTNSIPIPTERLIPKLTVLSIAPIVAATIKAVFEDESVSEIFQGENQEYIPPDSLAQLD